MKQIFTIFLFLLLGTILSYAQPLPCADPPTMTSTCMEACIICDIDGFQGRHDSNVMGEAPDGFCTIIVHNAQWIAFQAGSESLSIRLDVSNCNMGNGLEVAIYESFDCESFRQISNCRGGMNPVSNGTSGVFNTTQPLTIGQYYYLVMDGNFGDNCDWTFTVLEGSTQVDPLPNSGLIEGPATACPNISTQYQTTGVMGATTYEWELNGALIEAEADSVQIDWQVDGVYELCVTASNVCDVAPPTCTAIVVVSQPPMVFNEIICEGDSFQLNDTTFLTEAGNYEFNYLDSDNCDSTVFVNLEVVEASFTDLEANICEGDSIYVGGTPYFTVGLHTEILQNYLGCDSTINLNLGLITCEIMGETEEIPVVCNGEASGMLSFYIEDGTPPFSFIWERLGGPLSGGGSIDLVNEVITLNNLTAGTYLITINDSFGNDLVLIQDVTEPSVLTGTVEASNYNGWDISCTEASDGSLLAMPSGGLGPYSYQWSNGIQGSAIDGLLSGAYSVQITDAGGCTIEIEYTLDAPPPLVLNAAFVDPNCDGLETGIVAVQSLIGGVEPYLFDLSGAGFSTEQNYSDLPAGFYTLTAEDANGCTISDSAILEAPLIPIVELGENQRVDLGESTTLSVLANVPLDNFSWEEEESLSCLDCPEPIVFTLENTYYTISVTSSDGCTTVDSVLVSVDKRRDVYIPNAFSPNKDGRNDNFYIFAGPEVSEIIHFSIFDRWGELLLDQKNIQPNDAKLGWDGTFKGETMPIGIYTYFADIAFIDGIQFQYTGDVLLVR